MGDGGGHPAEQLHWADPAWPRQHRRRQRGVVAPEVAGAGDDLAEHIQRGFKHSPPTRHQPKFCRQLPPLPTNYCRNQAHRADVWRHSCVPAQASLGSTHMAQPAHGAARARAGGGGAAGAAADNAAWGGGAAGGAAAGGGRAHRQKCPGCDVRPRDRRHPWPAARVLSFCCITLSLWQVFQQGWRGDVSTVAASPTAKPHRAPRPRTRPAHGGREGDESDERAMRAMMVLSISHYHTLLPAPA